MTPCGIVVKTDKAVEDLMENVAEMVAGFQARQFKSSMEKDFYDLDETPASQMLYVCLKAIAHIWNEALVSGIEIKPVKFSKRFNSDFIIVHYRGKMTERVVKRQVGITCGLSVENGTSEEIDIGDDGGTTADEIQNIVYATEKIIKNPLKIAHEIIRMVVGDEWTSYAFIHNNTLTTHK